MNFIVSNEAITLTSSRINDLSRSSLLLASTQVYQLYIFSFSCYDKYEKEVNRMVSIEQRAHDLAMLYLQLEMNEGLLSAEREDFGKFVREYQRVHDCIIEQFE